MARITVIFKKVPGKTGLFFELFVNRFLKKLTIKNFCIICYRRNHDARVLWYWS